MTSKRTTCQLCGDSCQLAGGCLCKCHSTTGVESVDRHVEFWHLIEKYASNIPRKPVNNLLESQLSQARRETKLALIDAEISRLEWMIVKKHDNLVERPEDIGEEWDHHDFRWGFIDINADVATAYNKALQDHLTYLKEQRDLVARSITTKEHE